MDYSESHEVSDWISAAVRRLPVRLVRRGWSGQEAVARLRTRRINSKWTINRQACQIVHRLDRSEANPNVREYSKHRPMILWSGLEHQPVDDLPASCTVDSRPCDHWRIATRSETRAWTWRRRMRIAISTRATISGWTRHWSPMIRQAHDGLKKVNDSNDWNSHGPTRCYVQMLDS